MANVQGGARLYSRSHSAESAFQKTLELGLGHPVALDLQFLLGVSLVIDVVRRISEDQICNIAGHQSRHVAGIRSKNNTLEYSRAGMKNLTGFVRLANCRLDKITVQDIAAFVRTRRDAGLQVTSVNRQLEVLRRIFKLAEGWNETEKRLPRVEMLGGERHRDRVLSPDEEDRYLAGAVAVGVQIQDSYFRALGGIRARLRGKQPIEPKDPFLLRDVATVLINCALRPDRKRPENDSAERSGVALNGGTQADSDL